jgi:hypothetical protein
MRSHVRERASALWARWLALLHAIESNDEAQVADAVLRLSEQRRWLAPLAFIVGSFVLLFRGARLLVSNWRLMIIEILPAAWIWLAMYDLKAHVLHGKSFHVLRGPILIPIVLAMMAITAACFFLNAVFAHAIAQPGPPHIRAGYERARRDLAPTLAIGAGIGLLLGISTTVLTRYGRPWFTLSLSVVIGIMMIAYVAVPARLTGVKKGGSTRDKLAATAVSGALSVTVCTPPYLLGRLGILMLGSSILRIPGVLLLVVGFGVQAGASGAVRAIKLSASLTAGREPDAVRRL